MNAAAFDSIVWVTRRTIRSFVDGKLDYWRSSAHGVLVAGGWMSHGVLVEGRFILTMAHTLMPQSEAYMKPTNRVQLPGGEWVLYQQEPIQTGGDPLMTIAVSKPPNRRADATTEEINAAGVLALIDPSVEVLVHPRFADPYADIMVLGAHPNDEQRYSPLLDARNPMRVRTTPLRSGEPVFVATSKERTSDRAIATPQPGGLTQLRYDSPTVDFGDCGNPIVDERGELVGILAFGPAKSSGLDTRLGVVAELCKVLPRWLFDRITGVGEAPIDPLLRALQSGITLGGNP